MLLLAAVAAFAQVPQPPGDGTPSVATGSIPLTYTGGDSRVSIGINKDGHSQGEFMQVFGNNGEHAIVAQLWWDRGGAGGVQADYNWLWGQTLDQVREDPDSATVAKLSFAIDQNSQKDRQASVGFAIERKEFFLNFFLSGAASGSRNAGAVTVQTQASQNGTDNLGNYTQTLTELTSTLVEAQPYAYTVGVHGGHFSDAITTRFNGGVDYAKGDQGASETRVSVGVDKYLGIRGWSLSALAEHAQRNSPLDDNRSDNRWWLFLRYEFGGGGAFTPAGQPGNTAWIQRALHNPLVGHPRTVPTYVKRGKTTTTQTQGPKHYTALRPIAQDDAVSVTANSTGAALDVLANDSDPQGSPLTITAVTAPAHGTAQVTGMQIVYAPSNGFTGTDQFDYTVANTAGLSATAHVSVTISPQGPAQQPPVIRDDSATTPYAMPVTVNVLANDTDPGGHALTLASVTAPMHGSAAINTDGSITYTPAATFIGTDTFAYTASNGQGGSGTANVTITVLAPPGPTAVDDAATTTSGQAVAIDVLGNDSAPPGLTLTLTSVSQPAHGSVSSGSGGTLTYQPATGFSGTDNFSYVVSDGFGTATATVTVTVLPPDAPAARDDEATTPLNTPVKVDVTANDSDPNGYALIVKSVTTPAHGTVKINADNTVTYTPQANFSGTDTLAYTVGNNHGGTASADVTITVQAPVAPVAQADETTTPFNTPVAINVLANDSDPANLPLTVTQVSQPAHGSATINPNGTITYTPQANYFGNDAFSYTISNGYLTASANVAVGVQAPLPPVAVDDAAQTPFDTPVDIQVLNNDSDPNGLPLTISATTSPTYGTIQVNPNGTISYYPDPEFDGGMDSFTYTISDGYNTATATVTVTVDLPPAATANSFTATDAICTPDGGFCDICLDDHITNPVGLYLIASVTPNSSAGGTVVIGQGANCTYQATYTSPDPSSDGMADSFMYTIKDTYNRTSTATVDLTLTIFVP
jgi:hypothetical protein